jgi:GalNAc5-diNAcBac-PP-undecaprenol beta-1,3-glucosyltransferase
VSIAATVVVPTHDHGPLVELAVRSALAQTVRDVEVFVIGDGVPDVTRDIMSTLTGEEPRVRFFDHPKGPRHGEIYRHAALQEASGRSVCYLSDDDLWLPNHLEVLLERLERVDFAHTLPVRIRGDGRYDVSVHDLTKRLYREYVDGERDGGMSPPLTFVGHTMEAYRKLPHGWRTAPADVATDRHMWRQFLNEPWCRAASCRTVTAIKFHSPDRKAWSIDERFAETERWAKELSAEAAFTERLLTGVVENLSRGWEATAVRLAAAEDRVTTGTAQLARAEATVAQQRRRIEVMEQQMRELQAEAVAQQRVVAVQQRMVAAQRRRLETIHTSMTWRLRGRLLSAPLVGRAIRAAVRGRARRPPRTAQAHQP